MCSPDQWEAAMCRKASSLPETHKKKKKADPEVNAGYVYFSVNGGISSVRCSLSTKFVPKVYTLDVIL